MAVIGVPWGVYETDEQLKSVKCLCTRLWMQDLEIDDNCDDERHEYGSCTSSGWSGFAGVRRKRCPR